MIHWSLVKTFILIFILSIAGTLVLEYVFRYLGSKGYLGNLFPNVRGGIPRGIGLIPFILLSFLFLYPFNVLVLIIGIFAFIDDLIGRTKIQSLGIEWGQLSRGIGIILVIIFGYYSGLGLSSILIALLVQPINISDMQPGSTCMVTMIMSLVTILLMFILSSPGIYELPAFYTPLLLFLVVLGYCPLDFSGKIMLGEVGNHSLAIALGCSFYLVGGFWWVLILGIITTLFTAFIRRNTLEEFLQYKLCIMNPNYGDYFMDVLTGGGLGDLLRRIFLKQKQIQVTNKFLISLGFRRLLYNPYAPNNRRYNSNDKFNSGVL